MMTEEKITSIEQKIGYTFKCKTWLIEALTHKSAIDQNLFAKIQEPVQDYERLEFLGDSILSFLVARHFFLTTQSLGSEDARRFMPKELHRMKTSVINNALLSLIVIENGIHDFIIYNEKAEAFKRQFEKYVQEV